VNRLYTLDGREHHPIHRMCDTRALCSAVSLSPTPCCCSSTSSLSTDVYFSFPPFSLPVVVLRSFSFLGCADIGTCEENGWGPCAAGTGAAGEDNAQAHSAPVPPSACRMLASSTMRWRCVGVSGIGSL
jgi:hypothetical protein